MGTGKATENGNKAAKGTGKGWGRQGKGGGEVKMVFLFIVHLHCPSKSSKVAAAFTHTPRHAQQAYSEGRKKKKIRRSQEDMLTYIHTYMKEGYRRYATEEGRLLAGVGVTWFVLVVVKVPAL